MRSVSIRHRRLATLFRLSRVIASTLEPRKVLTQIINGAVRITKATSGSLLVIDRERGTLHIEVASGYTERAIARARLKVGEGITGWVAKTGIPLLVPDVTKDPRYVRLDKQIRCEMAVPLILEDEIIGVVNVNNTRVGAFTGEDLELLITLASLSAQIIQNARLFDTVRQQVRELDVLFTIGKSITGTLNLENVLNEIVKSAAQLMNTQICSLMLLSEDGRELAIKAVYGGSPDYIKKPNLPVAESLIGQAVKTRQPVTSMDVREERGYRYLDLARREGLCALLAVPMMVKGQVIGVINTYKSTRHRFTENEIKLLSSLADQSAIAIENARLYGRMIDLEERIRRVEKFGVLGELAVEIAHEVKNPLTIIKMLLYGLQVEDQKDLEIIRSEIDRMNRIVTQFLGYSRPGEPRSQPVDLNQILEATLQLVEHRVAKQKVMVERNFSRLPPVEVDVEKMEQAFLNLYLNALDAMPGGGRLAVATRRHGGEITITIDDTGTGIPPDIRDRIFAPFVTSKETGLGLGLSIVHRIVEQHHGEVRVRSGPGGTGYSTRFIIRLPVAWSQT
ncbi:MAG: GAF domain-containing protein [Deltaproteobacteria bacterium]|nr:GAF domain-containing protein [Deltaproteobacteria bacterium]